MHVKISHFFKLKQKTHLPESRTFDFQGDVLLKGYVIKALFLKKY